MTATTGPAVTPSDIDVVVSCSITKYRDGLVQWLEPTTALAGARSLGATGAITFDLSNACGGMLTGPAGELLAEYELAVDDLDAVVANPLQPAFLAALGHELGAAPGQVVTAPGQARVHTAGLAVALDEARRQNRLTPGATVLVVSAGAGPATRAALLVLP